MQLIYLEMAKKIGNITKIHAFLHTSCF